MLYCTVCVQHRLFFIIIAFVFVALGLFRFKYTVGPLGVFNPENLQMAFDYVVIACSLEFIRPGLLQGLQGLQWCGLA